MTETLGDMSPDINGDIAGVYGGSRNPEMSPCPDMSPVAGKKNSAAPDPAADFRSKAARRAAWDAWEASGGTLDTLPAGLVSATLDACRNKGRHDPKWR